MTTAESTPIDTSTAAGGGPVTLTLPPHAAMVRVARLTASSVASLTEMTIDDIDDVKIAVSEMITLLIQSGSRALLTLRFEVVADSFQIEASTPANGLDLGNNDVLLAMAVLDAVSESHDIAFANERILIRVVKSLADPTQG